MRAPACPGGRGIQTVEGQKKRDKKRREAAQWQEGEVEPRMHRQTHSIQTGQMRAERHRSRLNSITSDESKNARLGAKSRSASVDSSFPAPEAPNQHPVCWQAPKILISSV